MKIDSKNNAADKNVGMGSSLTRLHHYMSIITFDDDFPFSTFFLELYTLLTHHHSAKKISRM